MGAVVFCAMSATSFAQNAPAFRTPPPALRPLPGIPHPEIAPPRADIPLFLPPTLVPRAAAARRSEPYVPAALRRLRFRSLAPPDGHDVFTLRTSAGILAQLSLGLLAELRASDNVNSAPEPLSISDVIFDFTPVAHLTAGGVPGLQREASLEPEYYLDALYAPTSHQLVHAGQSAFLQHLLVRAGHASPFLHVGARVAYDNNLFALGGDTSAEETYTLFEVEPALEYRPSAKTTLHARSDWRQITLENPTGDHSELTGDAGFDCELSVKTTAGLAVAAGHIAYDQPQFGTQDYRQGSVVLAWKATEKLTLRAQAGVEVRDFHRPVPKAEFVSAVGAAVLEWQPDERTRVGAAFRVQNVPSNVQDGALVRETKWALEAQRDLGPSFYASAAADWAGRVYDAGGDQSELTLRPAVGYHLASGAMLDSMKIELFYQLRRHWNHGAGGDYTRNQAGVQMTVFF